MKRLLLISALLLATSAHAAHETCNFNPAWRLHVGEVPRRRVDDTGASRLGCGALSIVEAQFYRSK